MLIKKAADIPSSEITPKSLYLNRRKFLAGAAIGGRSGGGGWRGLARNGFAIVGGAGQHQD